MSGPIALANGDRTTADRLYELLDTLIAARLTFEMAEDGQRGTAALSPEKAAEARAMLDEAIGTAKLIIGDIPRPLSSREAVRGGAPTV